MKNEAASKSIPTLSKKKTSRASNIHEYVSLTKPGIIRGNILTASAGFFLASQQFDARLFAALICGTSLIIAAACVSNNIIDRDIDAHMDRTKLRPLVRGTIPVRSALMYAVALGVLGLVILAVGTNALTLTVGVFGLVMYVAVYGYYKRASVYGTHIGSISGATPPLAGYVAVTGRLDATAIMLFVILALWQMPHFFAIAMYRKADYARANIPAMPTRENTITTQRRIVGYVIAYGAASFGLMIVHDMSPVYAGGMFAVVAYWLVTAFRYRSLAPEAWGKRMFIVSLLAILGQSLLIATNNLF